MQVALDLEAEFVFLLNNDTIVEPNLLDQLVEVLQTNESAGASGPKIMYFDEPDRIWSGRRRRRWSDRFCCGARRFRSQLVCEDFACGGRGPAETLPARLRTAGRADVSCFEAAF